MIYANVVLLHNSSLLHHNANVCDITMLMRVFTWSQINGRNMDNKSVQEAIQIIGQNKDKVSMLIKKEGGGTVSLPAERFRSPEAEKKSTHEEGIVTS